MAQEGPFSHAKR